MSDKELFNRLRDCAKRRGIILHPNGGTYPTLVAALRDTLKVWLSNDQYNAVRTLFDYRAVMLGNKNIDSWIAFDVAYYKSQPAPLKDIAAIVGYYKAFSEREGGRVTIDHAIAKMLLAHGYEPNELAQEPLDSIEQDEGENDMSEKNAVALVRNDTKTVEVEHDGSEKTYTYVTTFDLQPDDMIVVKNIRGLALGKVKAVHERLEIQPNASITYAYVVAKIDMGPYNRLLEENAQIEKVLADAYRLRAQASFREQMLATLPAEALALLPSSVK
jgi:hypothetical protein